MIENSRYLGWGRSMFEYWNHLGARSFYSTGSSSEANFRHIGEAIRDSGLAVSIDVVAVRSILMKNYIIGDRTLISELSRTPWMGRLDGGGQWEFGSLPEHGDRRCSVFEVADSLRGRLKEEARQYLSQKRTVGLLLSGGMDSRIVAGIIRELQDAGEHEGDVVALTWGLPASRDVVYAQRIASRFGWQHIHFSMDAETLYNNIYTTGIRGAEFSPIHLHCMTKVAEVNGVDCILAASYGDSIGRGEYQGRKITDLPPILSQNFDHFGLLRKQFGYASMRELKKDVLEYRDRFPRRTEIGYREMEMQAHYMRRQLRPCMDIIDDRIPLHQMFTAPEVFGYMWGLSPETRSDRVYVELLRMMPGRLLEIPWARTGKIYGNVNRGKSDTYMQRYDTYGKWLREDCAPVVKSLLLSGSLQRLGIFNERSLKVWAKNYTKSKSPEADRLDEKIAWLASLAVFVDEYSVAGQVPMPSSNAADWVQALKGQVYGHTYRLARKVLK